MNNQLKKYYAFLESVAPANQPLVSAIIEGTRIIFEEAGQQPQPPQPEEMEENLPPVNEPAPQEQAQQPQAPQPAPQEAAPQPAPEAQNTASDVEKNVEKIATQQPSSFRDVAPTYKAQITELQKTAASILPQIAAFTSKNPNDKEAKKYQELLTQSAKSISQLAGYTARAGQVQQAPQQAPQQQAPQPQPQQ